MNLTIDLDVNVTKVNQSGDLIWSKNFGDPLTREAIYDVIIGPSGSLYMCGFVDGLGILHSKGIILAIDSSGNQLFCKYLGLNSEGTACNNLISDDQGFTSAIHFASFDTTAGTKLIRFDWNGNILKDVIFNGVGDRIYKLSDQSYLLYSTGGIEVIDSGFNYSPIQVGISFNVGGGKLRIVRGLNGVLYGLDDVSIIPFDSSFVPERQIIFGVSPDSMPGFIYDMHQIASDSSWVIIGFHRHESFYPGIKDHVTLIHTDQAFVPLKTTCLYSDLAIVSPLGSGQYSTSSMVGTTVYFATSAQFDSLTIEAGQMRIFSVDTSFSGLCDTSDTIPYTMTRYPFFHIPTVNWTYFVPCTTFVQSVSLGEVNLNPGTGECWDLTVGYQDHVIEPFDIKTYPNPFCDHLILSSTQQGYIVIFDQVGKIVFSRYLSVSDVELNLGFLSEGIYILQFRSDKGVLSKRLVKI